MIRYNQHGYNDRDRCHLTEEQFGELMEGGTVEAENAAAQAHLRTCEQCRSELADMREALALFRDTTSAFAQREFARTRPVRVSRLMPAQHSFSPGLAWAAAGLLVVAAGVPLGLRHKTSPVSVAAHHTPAAAPVSVSDEALLDDINREVSASVPASMQALEDPTGGASAAATDAQTSSTKEN